MMKRDLPAPLLLNAREAARLLNVSERLLWTMTADGDIPSVRVGRRGVRYLPDDLTRWIESRRTCGRAAELT